MLQAGVLERSKRLPDAAISFAQTEAPIKAVVLGATVCIILCKNSSKLVLAFSKAIISSQSATI
jgi:hypothetical protein